MSDQEILLLFLGRVASRLKCNRDLRELGWLACGFMGLLITFQVLKATIGSSTVLQALMPLFILASIFFLGRFAVMVLRPMPISRAAAATDLRADLHDEFVSAYWFISQREATAWVELVLCRAAKTALRLQPRQLFPLAIPRNMFGALVLLLAAGATAFLSPRAPGYPVGNSDYAQAKRAIELSRQVRMVLKQQTAPSGDGNPASASNTEGSDAAWEAVERLVRDAEADVDSDGLKQAIGTRDAKRLLQILEAGRKGEPPEERNAPPEGEQMTAELSIGILRRLQEMMQQGGGVDSESSVGAHAKSNASGVMPSTEPSEDGPESTGAARQSPAENALNAALRAMPGGSAGDRQVWQGEGQGQDGQQGGRVNSGSGAMGRRIGVTQRGAGEGKPADGDPAGDVMTDAVLGKRSTRLAAQLQRVRVEGKDGESDQGTPGTFYAATRAQAASLEYLDVAARQKSSGENAIGEERMPLAYRTAVRQYFLAAHAREK